MNVLKKREALHLIREVSQVINEGSLQPEQILRIVLQALDREMGFRNSMILLVNEERDQLICVSARGACLNANALSRQYSIPMGQGIVGIAAKYGNILRINNIGSEILYSKAVLSQYSPQVNNDAGKGAQKWAHYAIQSQLAVPLLLHGEVIGVLSLECEKSNAFDELDEELLTIIANQTTHVVNVIRKEVLNKKQYQHVNNALDHLRLLQNYMESLSSALPNDGAYSKAAALQLRGVTHLAMGESYLAFEQLETARRLWEKADLPLEILRSNTQAATMQLTGLTLPIREEETGVRLTKRESEVAQLVSIGLSNDEIAQRLFVSNRTVTTHLERIYRKLNIHSRAALAYYLNKVGSK